MGVVHTPSRGSSSARAAVFVAALIAVIGATGCAPLAAGLVLGTQHSSSSQPVPGNTPPSLSALAVASPSASSATGALDLSFVLADAESDPSSVTVEVALPGQSFATASPAAGSAPLASLPTTPRGTTYHFVWDSKKDTGPVDVTGATLRFTPFDARSGAAVTIVVDAQNKEAPVVKILSATSDKSNGTALVVFLVSDSASAATSVEVQVSLDGGSTFRDATPVAGSPATSNLATTPTGSVSSFAWDSRADAPGQRSSNVIFKLIPSNILTGTPATQGGVAIDNSVPPSVTSVSASATGSTVTVNYTIRDADSDPVTINVRVSVDGGAFLATAGIAALAPDTGLSGLLATPSGVGHALTYTASLAGGTHSVVVELTPSDTVVGLSVVTNSVSISVSSGVAPPIVTPASIGVALTLDVNKSGYLVAGGVVTVTWDGIAAGNTPATLAGATVFADLSQLGGPSNVAFPAPPSGTTTWTLTYAGVAGTIDTDAAFVQVRAVSSSGLTGLFVKSATSVKVDVQTPTPTALSFALSITIDTLQQGTINEGDAVTFAWSSRVSGVGSPVLVEADLTSFGQGKVNLFDDGTHGDAFPGDGTYALLVSFPPGSFVAQRFVPDWSVRVTDHAGNVSGWVAAHSAVPLDTQPPSLLAATLLDLDHDGSIDAADLVFDEPIAGFTAASVTVGGVPGASFSLTSPVVVRVVLATQVPGTDPKPVTYTPGTVTDLALQPLPAYTAAQVKTFDGAPPVILTARADDGILRLPGVDADDEVVLVLSEPVILRAPITAATIDSVLALPGGHTWKDGLGAILAATLDPTGKILTVKLSSTTSAPTIAVGDTITPDSTTIRDAAGNAAGAAVALAGSFYQPKPSFSISPTSGPAGTAVQVSGSNFVPGSTVRVWWGAPRTGRLLGTGPVNGSGALASAIHVVVPPSLEQTVSVQDDGGGDPGSATFALTFASGPPGWIASTDKLPTGRQGLAAVLGPDGLIYAIGGAINGTATSNVESYDPRQHRTAHVSGLNTKRQFLAAVVGADGKIYALGGEDDKGNTLATAEVYDTVSSSWSSITPMPTSRFELGGALGSDGLIYAIGGTTVGAGQPALSTVEAYDPASGTWLTRAPLALPRSGLGVVAGSDGLIYAIGGQSGLFALTTVESYDPSSNTWTARTAMPTARFGLGAVAASDGRIFAVAGQDPLAGTLTVVEAYDVVTGTWATLPSVAQNGKGFGATVGDDARVYLLGGRTSSDLQAITGYGPIGTLSPTNGAAGKPFLVTGSNFAANATVQVYWGTVESGTLLGTGSTDALGGLLLPIAVTVPAGAVSGVNVVTIVDLASVFPATGSFTVP